MLWKRLLVAAVSLTAVLIAAAWLIPLFYDFNRLKPSITKSIKEISGLDVTFGGDIELAVFPALKVQLNDVVIQNAPWGSRPETARVKQCRVKLSLLSLIKGVVKIDYLILSAPDVLFETQASGKLNFDLNFRKRMKASDPDAVPREPKPRRTWAVLVKKVRVEEGLFAYRDGRSGRSRTLTVSLLAADSRGATDPLLISLKGALDGEPIDVEGVFGPLSALMDADEPWPVSLTVNFAGATASVQGSIRDVRGLEGISMTASVEGTAISRTLKPAGLTLPRELGPFSIKARISDTEGTLALKELDVGIGNNDPARIRIDGAIGDLKALRGIEMGFTVRIEDLGRIGARPGRALPPGGSFVLTGRISDLAPKVFRLHGLEIVIGKTHIGSSGEIDITGDPPKLKVELASRYLHRQPAPTSGNAEPVWVHALQQVEPFRLSLAITAASGKIAVEELDLRLGSEESVEAALRGTVQDLLVPRGVDLEFSVLGKNPENFEKLFGKPVPLRGPFAVKGRIVDTAPKVLTVSDFRASVGRNIVAGSLEPHLGGEDPLVTADLSYKEIDLEPFALPEPERLVLSRIAQAMAPLGLICTIAVAKGKPALRRLRLTAGTQNAAEVVIGGSVRDLRALEGIELDFALQGADAADLGGLAGKRVPLKGPFFLSGRLFDQAAGSYRIRDLKIVLGDNDIKGLADVSRDQGALQVKIELSSPRIDFTPFALEDPAWNERVKPFLALCPWQLAIGSVISEGNFAVEKADLHVGTHDLLEATFRAAVDDLLDLRGVDLTFSILGSDVAALQTLTRDPLRISGPYSVSGRLLAADAKLFSLRDFQASWGSSDLSGSADLDLTGRRPRLAAGLSSRTINLGPPDGMSRKPRKKNPAPEGPGVPAAAVKKIRVLPRTRFAVDFLSAIDAGVTFRIGTLTVPGISFNDLAAGMALEDGHMKIEPFGFGIARGTVEGRLDLQDLDTGAEAGARLEAAKLDLGVFFDGLGVPRFISGTAGAKIEVHGRGDSVAALLAGLDGKALVLARDGELNTGALDRLGRTLSAQVVSLLTASGTEMKTSKLNCGATVFEIRDGLAHCVAFALDTDVTNVVGGGYIDLATENLDLTFKPSAKKGGVGIKGVGRINMSAGSLTNLFKIAGTFAAPAVVVNPDGVAVGVAKTAVGVTLFGPMGLFAPLVGAAGYEKDPCEKVLATAEKEIEVSEKETRKSNRSRRAESGGK